MRAVAWFSHDLSECPNVQFQAFFSNATLTLSLGFMVLVNTSTCTQSSTHPPKPKSKPKHLSQSPSTLCVFLCLRPLFYTIFTLLPLILLAGSHCQTLWLCGLVGKGLFSLFLSVWHRCSVGPLRLQQTHKQAHAAPFAREVPCGPWSQTFSGGDFRRVRLHPQGSWEHRLACSF